MCELTTTLLRACARALPLLLLLGACDPKDDDTAGTGGPDTDPEATTTGGESSDTGSSSDAPETDTSDTSDTSGAGVGPCYDTDPVDEPGTALDRHGWEYNGGFMGSAKWFGVCTIVDAVEAGAITTTLDCSADPDGPTTLTLEFVPTAPGLAWSPGQEVQVAYTHDAWSDGEYISMHELEGDALLLAFGHGGADGSFFEHDDHTAPVLLEENYDDCGMGGGQDSGLVVSVQFDVSGPQDEPVAMLQGDVLTLGGLDGEQYAVALYQAESGDIGACCHYGSYFDFMIHQLP